MRTYLFMIINMLAAQVFKRGHLYTQTKLGNDQVLTMTLKNQYLIFSHQSVVIYIF